jgi:PAS domain S-box-containing protein
MNSAEQLDMALDGQRYRLLINAVTDYAIFMIDAEGQITTWNLGAQRFKGYEEAEILGQNFAVFYTDEDRQSGVPAQSLETAVRDGKFESEGWRVRKDGSRFWAHVIIDPIRAPSGELMGFAKITRDLSERKLAEAAIRRSEEQFRLLVQGVSDYAIFMLDPEGRVSNWNLGAQKIEGYRRDEIIGKHFSLFYTEEDRNQNKPQQVLEIATREGRFEEEGWRVRKDGSGFWAHTIVTPIRDDRGTIIGFGKITRDVTEMKQAQLVLEQTREALFQSQKMEAVGQLTGGLAHDFNNLLAGISGSLELMERRLAQGRIHDLARYITVAQESSKRAASLTHRLLAFSRRQTLDPKSTNINRLAVGMEDLIRRTVGPAITTEVAIESGLWKTMVDQNQLENALLNLCLNARDAMPNGGHLMIETINKWVDATAGRMRDLPPGQYVTLSVSDNGTGMTQAVIERAFDPFYTTKPIGMGTGLGLSMVYGFVRQSSGQARIHSVFGKGTNISLYLPRHIDPEDDKEAAEPAEPPGELVQEGRVQQRETVLVVDDEPAVLMLVSEVMEDMGYTTIEATDGPSGLKILQSDARIDLLITDVGLPGLNGRQMADAARVQRAGLKVLFITGYADSAVFSHHHLEAGMQVLTKPFAMEELARRVRDLIKPT